MLFAPPPADPARHNATCSVFAVFSVCCVTAVYIQSVLFTPVDTARHNVCCVSAIHVQSVLFTPAYPARQYAPCSVFAVLVQYMHSQCPLYSVCCVSAIHVQSMPLVQCLLC